MDEDFERLMELLARGEGEEEIFRRASHFFAQYREAMAHGSDASRDSMKKRMSVLHEKLQQYTAGLSEEERAKILENPRNLMKEQWEGLQGKKEEQPKKVPKKKSKWVKL